MPNFFYYDYAGQKRGPVNEQQLRYLVTQNVVTPNTLLETESGQTGKAGQLPGLFAPAAPPPLAAPPRPQAGPLAAVKIIQNINTYFKFYWLGLAAGYPSMGIGAILFLIGLVAADQGGNSSVPFAFIGIGALLTMAGSVLSLASVVYMCLLLYHLWKLIPPDIARTTPGKAVGFLFIPFFNFYWMFVAYQGLGADMNKTLQRHGIPYQVKENLGVITCVLYCVAVILGFMVSLAGCIVQVFFFQSVKNGAIAMLKRS